MNSLEIITFSRFAVQRKKCGNWYTKASGLLEGHFVTDGEPKVANDGSMESCDQELPNDVFILVCGGVWHTRSSLPYANDL